MRKKRRLKKFVKKNKFIFLIVFFLLLGVWYFSEKMYSPVESGIIIREPAVAGRFYPKDSQVLNKTVESLLDQAEFEKVYDLKALVAPHAGYVYSGFTAAQGFKQLIGRSYDTVILIAPSHYVLIDGFTIENVTHYKTPLGLVELSPKVDELRKDPLYTDIPTPKEHSLEVELPFLQKVLKDFKIIPIITGNINPQKLAKVIENYVDDKSLIVASTDLSHYYPYDDALVLDKKCTDSITSLDVETIASDCESCGKIPVLTLMFIAKDLAWKGKLLDYRNSGDTAGDKSRVVGYSSIAFYEKELDEKEEKILLYLARQTLNSFLKDGEVPKIDESKLSPNLKKVQGCFVTLDSDGALRGCIGHIIPQEELYKCVIDNAISAAVNDRRFKKVDYDESKNLGVEVSVLSVPKKLDYDSPDDLLRKLRPMIDGVVIKSGWRQSTFLPQVWDSFPDKQSFLANLCLKAGLSLDCWKSDSVEIHTYQADVFHEKEFE